MTLERMLPLYEAKMFHHYDHRWATYTSDRESREVTLAEKQNPEFAPLPRYWVRESLVNDALDANQASLLAFRDITNSTNERTTIATKLPRVAIGHTAPLVMSDLAPRQVACLWPQLGSFVFDFVTRQKIGGTHLTYGYLQQLTAIPLPLFENACVWHPGITLGDWVRERVLELTYTAWELEPFARDLGYAGAPFRWSPERRVLLRAELDAAFFHLYGLSREDTDYVMETFFIVKRKDEAAHGEYRTKRLILEVYDALGEAMKTGKPYETRLNPRLGRKG